MRSARRSSSSSPASRWRRAGESACRRRPRRSGASRAARPPSRTRAWSTNAEPRRPTERCGASGGGASGPRRPSAADDDGPRPVRGRRLDGQIGEELVADPLVEQVADRQLFAGRCRNGRTSMVPDRRRTPVGSNSATRAALTKIAGVAPRRRTRGRAAARGPRATITTSCDAADRLTVRVQQRQAHEARHERRRRGHSR